jgi:hypothetical protein
VELKGVLNTGAVSFQNNAGDDGLLVLDHAATTAATNGFRGTIVGFLFDGTSSDTLDLKDVKFNSGATSWSFTENKSTTAPGGVLTVTDHSGDTANISLLGQYLAGGQSASSASSNLFSIATVGSGGTLATTSPA